MFWEWDRRIEFLGIFLLLSKSCYPVKLLSNVIEFLFQTGPIFEMECQVNNKIIRHLFAFNQGLKLAKAARDIFLCVRKWISLTAEWHINAFPVSRRGSSNSKTLRILADLFSLMQTNCARWQKNPDSLTGNWLIFAQTRRMDATRIYCEKQTPMLLHCLVQATREYKKSSVVKFCHILYSADLAPSNYHIFGRFLTIWGVFWSTTTWILKDLMEFSSKNVGV